MIYVSLAYADYGSGHVMAYASRLGWRNTGGEAVTKQFSRRVLEWLSGRGVSEAISVCHVPVSGVDGVTPTIDTLDMVTIVRKDIEFLSEDNNISQFD